MKTFAEKFVHEAGKLAAADLLGRLEVRYIQTTRQWEIRVRNRPGIETVAQRDGDVEGTLKDMGEAVDRLFGVK